MQMNRTLPYLALLIGLVAGYACAREESAPRYSSGAPSEAGTGTIYMGREIARVMSFHGAQWLERPEREREERTDLILPMLELKPGMVVADIGAGTGYYAWRMAKQVAPGGRVLAVEVQREMLLLLEKQMVRRGVDNVVSVLGETDDPKLPANSVDLALMVDVYHEFDFPYEMLARITEALKPGGRVVFVEFKAEDASIPIFALHKMSEAQVKKEASVHALEWVKTTSTLPWQHVIVFRKLQN